MNFDYAYEESVGNVFLDFVSDNLVAVIAIAVAVIIVAVFVVIFIMMKKGKIQLRKEKKTIVAKGYAFCPRCYNRFFLASDKCPYCKQKRMRY